LYLYVLNYEALLTIHYIAKRFNLARGNTRIVFIYVDVDILFSHFLLRFAVYGGPLFN
jgi:hypothetical protein